MFAVGAVRVVFTSRADGDFALDATDVDDRRRRVTGGRAVTWLRQVHGTRVVTVGAPGHGVGFEADAAVTDRLDVALSVITADCAPVAVWSSGGSAIGIAHAGWRGLCAGVVENVIGHVRSMSASGTEICALLGPCIHPECYEFGSADLELVRAHYGDVVCARTTRGRPALDLPATVRAAVTRAGGVVLNDPTIAAARGCTACDRTAGDRTGGDAMWFSWRATRDRGRQGAFIWREPEPAKQPATREGTV